MFSNINKNLEKFNSFKRLDKAIKEAGILNAKADAIHQKVSLFLKKMADKGLEPDRFIDELDRMFSEAVRLGRSMDDRMLMLDEICNQDPLIILGIPPKSHPLEAVVTDRHALSHLRETLRQKLLDRADKAILILKGFLYPFVMGRPSQVPVLIGPPATGKSLLPRVLVDCLNDMGIKTALAFFSATVDHGTNDDFDMKMLGIDTHWGNSHPGELYRLSKNYDLIIAIIDEIDKKIDRRVFLELFDSNLPLQDRFARAVANRMNMRHKVAFIATANEETWKTDVALKSRLISIKFEPYTARQKMKIVKNILESTTDLTKLEPQVRKLVLRKLCNLIKSRNLDVREALGFGSTLVSLVDGLDYEAARKEIRMAIKELVPATDTRGDGMGFR